jgi:uncharacterized protein
MSLAQESAVGQTLEVTMDITTVDDSRGLVVLLHPHPDFGGDRFHPFIEALFRRLPERSVSAIRFDFSSAELTVARQEAVAAIDEGVTRCGPTPVILAGYSFGAGIAAHISDERIAGWYLLAPPSATLSGSTIGNDPRPKAIVVPEHDQFSPPTTIVHAVASWENTEVTTAPNTDHFLHDVQPIVVSALSWIERITRQ